jgi:hypothetical protein
MINQVNILRIQPMQARPGGCGPCRGRSGGSRTYGGQGRAGTGGACNRLLSRTVTHAEWRSGGAVILSRRLFLLTGQAYRQVLRDRR